MERLQLDGKVAIVTGSTSGIGEGIARLLLRRGAKVVIHGRNVERLNKTKDSLVKELGKEGQVATSAGDVRNSEARKGLVDTAVNTFGQLDILVNCAGQGHFNFIRDVTESELDENYAMFVKGPVLLSQLALPHLIKTKGSILNISAGVTQQVEQAYSSCAACYAALECFTKYAAVEFGHAGVRVNAIRVGVIETPGYSTLFADDKRALMDFLATTSVQGRNGIPDDIAQAVAYLVSDAADFVTGTMIEVDGGRMVYRERTQKSAEPKYDDMIEQAK